MIHSASNDINKAIRQLGIANSVTEVLIEYAEQVFGVEVLHLFDHLSAQATALGAADVPVTFGDGMQVTHAVSDCVNKGRLRDLRNWVGLDFDSGLDG